MQLNYEHAIKHVELLTGDRNYPVTFQFFYDVKGELQRPDLAQHFVSTLDNAWVNISKAQGNLCGIYIGVNETDGKGRSNENISKYRALFVDFDGDVEPTWKIEPSFVNMRDPTHGHAYWSLLDGEITDPDEFKSAQKRLSLYYGTDGQVTDPARVLRLCGTTHLKNPLFPSQYYITRISARVNQKYSIKELLQEHSLNAEKDAELNHWIDTRKGNLVGIGYEESERYNEAFRKWLSVAAPPAVAGSGNGNHTLYKVMSWGHDHGIPLATAQRILWETYAPRCEPPFEPHQQDTFNETCINAYHHATSAAGCKTAKALFGALPPLPAPVDGWDSNLEIVKPAVADGDIVKRVRLSIADGENLLPQLTEKSGHYHLAECFDGIVYDGIGLIRSEKQFYISNGRSWYEVSDEVVKSQIQRFYSMFKPNDTFTRGVLNVLCDQVNVPEVRNGMWLDNPAADGSNVVVFKNGMVDFTGVPPYQLQKHSVNFFNFSEVDYNYYV